MEKFETDNRYEIIKEVHKLKDFMQKNGFYYTEESLWSTAVRTIKEKVYPFRLKFTKKSWL